MSKPWSPVPPFHRERFAIAALTGERLRTRPDLIGNMPRPVQ